MGEGDDGLLRIADFELFRQGAKTKLTTDLGGLETVLAVGKLQPVDWGPQNEVSKGEWGKGLRDRKIQKRGCKTNCPRA